MNAKTLDELAQRVINALPNDVGGVRDELRSSLREALTSALANTDLVTREEFEVQAGVLARSREKLEALEAKLSALELQHAKD